MATFRPEQRKTKYYNASNKRLLTKPSSTDDSESGRSAKLKNKREKALNKILIRRHSFEF